MKYHYVWLMWSSAFLVPWIILYLARIQQHRVQMWWASVFMPHLTKLPVLILSGA
jgi:hypothetical protein